MLWLKAFHVVFVVTWFAGLFYLPRLFVYHAAATDPVSIERFILMERRLFAIMSVGAVLAAMVPVTIGHLLPDPALVVACVALGGVFMISPATLAPVTLQEVVPNEFRGQVFAVYLLVMSLIGYAIGPFAVAFVSDGVLHDESKVHISLAIVGGVFLPISAAILALGLRARWALDTLE